MSNPLNKGSVYSIPPGGFWPLDGQTGKETVFVIAAHEPLRGMDRVAAEMVHVTENIPAEGERIQAVEAFLKSRFRRVEAFTFQHD